MSDLDLDARLEKAVALRNTLSSESQRVRGRKEAAEKALAEIEAEIREKNLDPDTLEDTLQTLKEAYRKAVEAFEADLQQAQQALSPYLNTTETSP